MYLQKSLTCCRQKKMEVPSGDHHLCVIRELDSPPTLHTHDDFHGLGLGPAVGVFVRIASSVS